MSTMPVSYERSQAFRLLWVVLPLAMLFTGAVLLVADGPQPTPVPALVWIAVFAVPSVVLGLLGRFTVQVDARWLRWHFGFFGWPRWRVALADIASVETTTTGWLEGQGIRFTREGMPYNVACGGAVRLSLRNGRQIRLGSDEPERLAAFLGHRLKAS